MCAIVQKVIQWYAVGLLNARRLGKIGDIVNQWLSSGYLSGMDLFAIVSSRLLDEISRWWKFYISLVWWFNVWKDRWRNWKKVNFIVQLISVEGDIITKSKRIESGFFSFWIIFFFFHLCISDFLIKKIKINLDRNVIWLKIFIG